MAESDYVTRYGQWAVIAGASEGLGAAFAAELAGRAMHLLLLARREEQLAELAERLRRQHGVEVRYLALDLADPAAAERLAPAVADIEVGVLIYNAAASQMGRFVTMEADALERMVQVNVRGPLTFLRAILPPMHERCRGAVVLMSSLAGMQGSPGVAAYAATKAFNTILGEVLMASGLALSLGWPLALGPWLYPLYYVVLLVARERDDDRRCAEKYGPLWAHYRQRVPWRIVPRIY